MLSVRDGAGLAASFLVRHDIGMLNVGGPRQSMQPRGNVCAYAVMLALLRSIGGASFGDV